MSRRSIPNTRRCPDLEELAAAVMSRAAVPHAESCSQCAEIVAQLRGLDSALGVLKGEVFEPESASPARARWSGGAGLIAAAAVVVVAVTLRLLASLTPISLSASTWRGDVRVLDVTVEKLEGRRLQLDFAPVRDAASHVVVLFGPDGQVLERRVLPADCSCTATIIVPDELAGETCFWKVEAISTESITLAAATGVADSERSE